jgi:glycyl-tRNA synthetase beta chain
MGFAKKQGVPVESLEIVQTEQGEYIQARVQQQGKPAIEVLGSVLAEAVKGLTFPKMMRWGDGSVRYVRPVRWIVALLDDAVVPVEIAGVTSGRKTRGHRTLAPAEVELQNGSQLLDTLRAAFVLVDPKERRESIRKQGDALAEQAGGKVIWTDALLDENTWLVEYPTALLGHFDEDFLELPRPILVTAMAKHQRFFPLEDAEGKLLPNFISIRNGGSDHLDVVRDGNERVLVARFADARHFFAEDRRTPLDQMAAGLDRLVFQEKLGTVLQKRLRLEQLIGHIAKAGLCSADDQALAIRAATLAKADLVSKMVIELPALQGIMGREYARLEGENSDVANAIAEHYRPRFAGDDLPDPECHLGALLAITDRVDTLVGYVGIGILPSGSSDPYGLRRAAQGLVQLLAGLFDMPSLNTLIEWAAEGYQAINGLEFDVAKVKHDLGALMVQRLEVYLTEQQIRSDLIDAVILASPVIDQPILDIVARARDLNKLADHEKFVATTQAAARVANILGSSGAQETLANVSGEPEVSKFQDPSEQSLLDAIQKVSSPISEMATKWEYAAIFDQLATLANPINALFDNVMVMADDSAVKVNRLLLLRSVDALFRNLADFTKVGT